MRHYMFWRFHYESGGPVLVEPVTMWKYLQACIAWKRERTPFTGNLFILLSVQIRVRCNTVDIYKGQKYDEMILKGKSSPQSPSCSQGTFESTVQ